MERNKLFEDELIIQFDELKKRFNSIEVFMNTIKPMIDNKFPPDKRKITLMNMSIMEIENEIKELRKKSDDLYRVYTKFIK